MGACPVCGADPALVLTIRAPNALGLCLDIPGNQIATGRIDWNLARAKKQVANADAMIVWTNCGSSFGRFDDLFLRHN